MINEYKNIKDYYSWSDEVEKESDHAINTNLPKIYDLRTPQKKSERKKTLSSESSEKMYSSDSSDVMFDPNYDYKSTEFTKDSKPTNTISSSSRITSMPTKTDLSIVDKILLEESSYAKHSKTGSVNKAKQLQSKPVNGCLRIWINDTLCYFQAEKSSTSHKMSKLYENELKIAEDEELFHSDDDEAGILFTNMES